ncbi:DUF222 domain-containing protein [Geodermatophilus sp. CPCC 206100]|uniref:HNH endonuclease signature motif containing protein n=1 Tax=Geodermatophilus sp. CPCC 206100 TaxID=3020054 RepID=UPI003B008CFE
MLATQPPRPPGEGVPIPVRPDKLLAADEGSDLADVADIWAADARAARAAAELAVWVARLARRRRIEAQRDEFGARGAPGRDTVDRRPPCLADVSEGFVPELALIRGCTEAEAAMLAVESVVLVERLPAVWSELYQGHLDLRRARVLADLLGEVSPATAAAVLAAVLPGAAARTAPQLRERTRRVLARVDADAAELRRRNAARRADVRVQPVDEGLSALVAELPTPAAHACADAVRTYADLQRAGGDDRPIGVIRAAVVQDLILRPWDTRRPAVTAQLTIHADLPALDTTGPDQSAAEVDGTVVSAAQCRELLAQLGVLGVGRPPRGGSVTVAVHAAGSGRLLAVATRNQLARAAGSPRRRRGTGRRVPEPTGRHVDGSPSRQVDEPTPRPADGPGLRRPADTHRYRPTAAQRRFVLARDRRCRWPGCRRPPVRSDLDHVRPYATGGRTACTNLCCLCRTHHRLKTHTPGWAFILLPDGRLRVRTPSGITRTSTPPGWAPDPEPDPPWLDETAPPDPALG